MGAAKNLGVDTFPGPLVAILDFEGGERVP